MQPAARVGSIDFDRCPLPLAGPDDLWLVDLYLQGYSPPPTERLLLPNRLVEALDFLRVLVPRPEGPDGQR